MTTDIANKDEDAAFAERGNGVSVSITSEILTTKEAANYVRLGKPTLERFRISGAGPPYCKLGGAVRYRKADLNQWLESRLTRSTSEGA